MNEQFNRTKRFSEILDHTFQLTKNYFSPFFLIFLFILGPVFLLEAILLLTTGTGLIRHLGMGANTFEQIIMGFDEDVFSQATSVSDLSTFATLVLTPLATVSILLAVKRIKDGENFTAGGIIKQAGKRFGAVLGSSIIVGLIFIVAFVAVIVAIILPSVMVASVEPVSGILLGLGVFLILGLLMALWFSRWGFYMAAVFFKEGFPGIGYSWRLTRKNTWRVFGLFIVIGLITSIISGAIGALFGAFLGNSVLFTIITNLVSMLTYMISAVAYSVIYFDLKLRHDGDDLREMIDEYQNN